jgi:FlaA1/EpsC-like NDP-sugar epimerase
MDDGAFDGRGGTVIGGRQPSDQGERGLSLGPGTRIRGLRMVRVATDVALLALAYLVAFHLRFDAQIPEPMMERMFLTLPFVVGAKMGLLYAAGLHRRSWRYISLRDAIRLFAALGIAATALLVARNLAASEYIVGPLAHGAIPLGVILIDAVLSFVGIGGVRVARRMQAEVTETRRRRPPGQRRSATLLVGAGEAGALLAREIAARPDLGIRAVGFLDDNPAKVGSVIRGVRVLGRIDELEEIAARAGAEQVLITIASAPRAAVRRITARCADADLPAKIIPGLFELVGGGVSITRFRDVAIEDLLGREVVEMEMDEIARHLAGRPVLVTGAGGSIGSELARQIAQFSPSCLVLLDKSEGALFTIDEEIRELTSSVPVEAVLADICDERRVDELLARVRPSIIFHAAAHKHVPLMEANPGEAVKNNLFGTKTLAEAADRAGVDAFVAISTDKAVNPSSVMGSTKRAAELFVEMLDRSSSTRFMTVRFGNVLDSNGSVIPTFRRQIERGGPVTVTHPEMTRYFMTIPEACQLVLQAASMGEGGEIFILDMGEPVRIVDLAHDLVRLSGYEPGTDIEIAFTGVRPGEKLHEELAFPGERTEPTEHPKILVGRSNGLGPSARLAEDLAELLLICDTEDSELIRTAIQRLVRAHRPEPPVPDAPHAGSAEWHPSPTRG